MQGKDPDSENPTFQYREFTDEEKKAFALNDDDTFTNEYFNRFISELGGKVLPIKIGEKVIGETCGDIESGDYEFRIWDRDFLNKLQETPTESRPNENCRALHWRRAKKHRMQLRPGNPDLFFGSYMMVPGMTEMVKVPSNEESE